MDKIKYCNLVTETYSVLPPPPLYKRVEYLQSSTGVDGYSDRLHVDTGIDYFADFEIECMRTDAVGSHFAGISNNVSLTTSSDYCFVFANSSSSKYTTSASILSKTKCKWKDGEIYINDTYVTSLAKPFATNGRNFMLYGVPTPGDSHYYNNIRIYSCKLWDSDGNLVRDMYPCRRIADSVLGFYDEVTDTFFTKTGTGSFIAGNDL